jgi:hypothetical protein
MLDPKKQHEIEQAFAALVEHYPALWRSIYIKCTEEGFSPIEAMDLVKTYILAQNPSGTNVPKT